MIYLPRRAQRRGEAGDAAARGRATAWSAREEVILGRGGEGDGERGSPDWTQRRGQGQVRRGQEALVQRG